MSAGESGFEIREAGTVDPEAEEVEPANSGAVASSGAGLVDPPDVGTIDLEVGVVDPPEAGAVVDPPDYGAVVDPPEHGTVDPWAGSVDPPEVGTIDPETGVVDPSDPDAGAVEVDPAEAGAAVDPPDYGAVVDPPDYGAVVDPPEAGVVDPHEAEAVVDPPEAEAVVDPPEAGVVDPHEAEAVVDPPEHGAVDPGAGSVDPPEVGTIDPETGVVDPSDAGAVAPSGAGSVDPPEAGVVDPPEGGEVVDPPEGGAVVGPPEGGAVVGPPEHGAVVDPPVTGVVDPSDAGAVAPSGAGSVDPPEAGVIDLPEAEAVVDSPEAEVVNPPEAGSIDPEAGKASYPRTLKDVKNPLLRYYDRESMTNGVIDNPGYGNKPKMMFGPSCWRCYCWNPWWSCVNCEKSFHRSCAFYAPHFPRPLFNMPIEEANSANFGESIMLKCTECFLREKTIIPPLVDVSVEELNKTMANISMLMHCHYKKVLQEVNDKVVVVSPQLIATSIQEDPVTYKTAEAFKADFRLVKFQAARHYGRFSDESRAMDAVMKAFGEELRCMIICFECYKRRYDPNQVGKLLSAKLVYKQLESPCPVPHPVIWVKLPDYSSEFWWPAKLLSVDSKYVALQCLNEKSIRFIELKGTDPKIDKIFHYSEQDINNVRKDRQYKDAKASCNRYIENLKSSCGPKVVLPSMPIVWKRSLKLAFESMFHEN